ncbi:mannosyltransferase putative-domain-containing protein [Chytriomyces sp. MP71]|nr:mannosyltransferase putative-domain-containing protein [Chytriomyces sp. MP71]
MGSEKCIYRVERMRMRCRLFAVVLPSLALSLLLLAVWLPQPWSRPWTRPLRPESNPKRPVRVLFYNTHAGTRANAAYVSQRLGLTFAHFDPDVVKGAWEMNADQSRELINAGYARLVCDSADVVIVSDTFPHARALVESLLVADQEKQCNTTIIAELTNRFDWGLEENRGHGDAIAFHKNLWQIQQHDHLRSRILWTANNPLEAQHLANMAAITPEFRLLRPTGYSSLPGVFVPKEEAELVAVYPMDGRLQSPILYILDQLQIPHKVLPKKYGGPHTLKQYKAFIEIPYQVSTMKLYENLAAGVVMLIPTARFLRELILKDLTFFYPIYDLYCTNSGHEPDWSVFMDYYHRDLSPYMYYFDSWEQLKQLATSNNPIDTRNVRQRGSHYYETTIRNKTLHGWASLFNGLGYKDIRVDGYSLRADLVDPPFRARLPDAPRLPTNLAREAWRPLVGWQARAVERVRGLRGEFHASLTGLELGAMQLRRWIKEENPGKEVIVRLPSWLENVDAELVEHIDALDRWRVGQTTVPYVKWSLIQSFTQFVEKAETVSEHSYLAFTKFARMARISQTIINNEELLATISASNQNLNVSQLLTRTLDTSLRLAYPWLLTMNIDIGLAEERGIVIVNFGDVYAKPLQIIMHLRYNLHCDLPIELFYNGYGGFEAGKFLTMSKVPGVHTRNLNDIYLKLSEYNDRIEHLKAFAILASKFKEVIYVDADTLLLQNPSQLLDNSKSFLTTGVFMLKSPSFAEGHSQWLPWFLGGQELVSETARHGRHFQNLSETELHPGLMAFDKTRMGVFHGILAGCHLSRKNVWSSTFTRFFGMRTLMHFGKKAEQSYRQQCGQRFILDWNGARSHQISSD